MKTSTDTINKMCNESQIILLQEHWLYPDELQLMSQLNPNFSGFRLSSMCLDDKFITGRLHGGLEYYGNNPFHKAQLTLLNMKTLVFWD